MLVVDEHVAVHGFATLRGMRERLVYVPANLDVRWLDRDGPLKANIRSQS